MGLDVATESVITTLWMQGAVGAVVYIIFECVRGNREVFAPKLRSQSDRCPPAPPSGPFAWVMPIVKLNDEDTLKAAGLDALVFLRFLKLCAKMMLACGVVGLILLAPIYATTGPGMEGVNGISHYTMGNIKQGGDRLWAPLLCMWGFTILFLYLMNEEYKKFVSLRQTFMRDGSVDVPDQQMYSVMVEDVPTEYRSSDKLRSLFEELFPGQISSAKMAMKYDSIIKVAAERKVVLVNLEKAIAALEADDDKVAPMVKVDKEGNAVLCGMCCGDEEVEAIPHWTKELQRLNDKIVEMKAQAEELDNHVPDDEEAAAAVKSTEKVDEDEDKMDESCRTATGFVTFTSKRAQAAAYQLTVLSHKYPELKAYQAQSPKDVIWSNTFASTTYCKTAAKLTKIAYITGLLFWGLILASIAGISQLSNLEKIFPFLKQLDPTTYSILQGQLPVIALIVFIALLPIIFTAISVYIERRKTITAVKNEVVTWLFAYQLANVYLMLLAGSVLAAISDIIDNPFSIVSLLAGALPGVATFFINFFLVLLLSGVPIFLLRIGPLVMFKLFRSCSNPRALTRRDIVEGPLADFDIAYEVFIPKLMYALCVGLTYLVIAPILVFVIGLFFVANYLAWKYQMVYVIVPNVQSGGKYWYKLFNFSMVGMMASTITMIGYMAIKEGAAQAPLLFPLPFVVNIFWNNLEDKYQTFSSDIAHTQALAADLKTGEGSSEQLAVTFTNDFYLPPPFAGPSVLAPEPYRVQDTDLLDEQGCLNAVYHKPTAAAGEAAAAAEEDINAPKTEVVNKMLPMEVEEI